MKNRFPRRRSEHIRRKLNEDSTDSIRQASRRVLEPPTYQPPRNGFTPITDSASEEATGAVKRRFKVGWRVLSLLIVGVLSYALLTAWQAPEYRISGVKVSGLQRLTEAEVAARVTATGMHSFAVVPEKINLTDQEIAKTVYFQEKWFDFEILRKNQPQTNLREEIQPIIYRIINNKIEFLIIKKWDGSKNKWCYRLIKGGVEKNETHNQTISREVQEEVGIAGLIISKKIHHYRFTSFDGITHDVYGYLAECKTPNISKYKLQNNDEEKIKQVEWYEAGKAIELLEFTQEKEAVIMASRLDLFSTLL